jgi:hypothetical protein
MGRLGKTTFENEPIISRREAKSRGLSQYFTGEPCQNGHLATRSVRGAACLLCSRAYGAAWKAKRYAGNIEELRQINRDKKLKNPAIYMLTGCRSRARRKGIPFTITLADIMVPENCPCCSRKLEQRSGPAAHGPLPQSPSLDQIQPGIGYVPGNVAVICWRCNSLKHDATSEELRTVLRWMEAVQPQPTWLRLVA